MSRWIRLPLGSALVFAVLAAALAALAIGHTLPVWAAALIALAAAALLFVPIRGRLVASQWPGVAWRYLRRRGRPVRPALPDPADISVIAGEAGIRWDGHTLVAVVEVAPTPTLTRESDGHAESGSELPLSLVTGLMTQYGLHLDIDIISSGRHVPAGTAYRTVYSQSVGPRPIVGQRRTWLVLRLNDLDNLGEAAERGPSRRGAPAALAAAAHRVVQRLGQEQIRAHVLSAEELDDVTELLMTPADGTARERWTAIETAAGFITNYLGDAALMAAGQLDRWWSWRTEDVLVTIRLTGAAAGAIRCGVLLRYVQHGKPDEPLPDTKLELRTGDQGPLFTAGLPAGQRALAPDVPSVDAAAVEQVRLPIGPSGQILGQFDDGTLVAAALWDQSVQPQRWRIDAQLGTELARQLVLRALVTGAVVAIHTDSRARWDGLVSSVGDPERLDYATGARACDIAIFDGRPVTAVPARTVLRILGRAETPTMGADMTLVEVSDQWLEVTVGQRDPVLVRAIRSREEDRYLGLGPVEAAPRRTVSTEPVLTRAPRRPAAAPAPVVPAPGAAPTRSAAPNPAGEPAPLRPRTTIGGPQRVAREQRPAAPVEPPDGPRRDYRLPSNDQPPRR
ncbi:MAG TPA: type VII secretion protein EccE [Mycobacterium sp.]|nr:type VII secretion protein EccE [Mycobacterium sp.]